MADRPVVTESVMVPGLEFIVAQAEGHPSPEVRFAAEHTNTYPVVRLFRIVRVRDLLFVYPLVGVELVCLKKVRQASGFSEPAIWQLVDRLHAAIALKIDLRPSIQEQALHA